MGTLGVGIVTYNRLGHLKACVERVRQFSSEDVRIVVADDGSSDGSREWAESEDLLVLGHQNRGVCWNKNRALFALQQFGCDPIILLEDDCWPAEVGWDLQWRVATALFGHLSFAHEKLAPWTITGAGTPLDPIVNSKATAQCSSVSGLVLGQVGFFDTRFRGYGVGHAEWTTRVKRAGAGFKNATLPDGRRARANLYIHGGLEAQDAPTFRDNSNVASNQALFDRIKDEPIYRHPWTTAEEREAFIADMAADGISADAYLAATGSADTPPALAGSPALAAALQRLLTDEASASVLQGWLVALSAGVPVVLQRLLPALPLPMAELLAERLKPSVRALLLNPGLGVLWWGSNCAEVVALEQDERWVRQIPGLLGHARATVQHCRPDAFPRAVAELKQVPDITVFDGPERSSSLLSLLPKLPTTAVVLCCQMQRREATLFADTMRRAGLRELRLRGPVPAGAVLETASIYYRDGNILGL